MAGISVLTLLEGTELAELCEEMSCLKDSSQILLEKNEKEIGRRKTSNKCFGFAKI